MKTIPEQIFDRVVEKAREVLGPNLKAFRHTGGSYYIVRGNELNPADDTCFKIRLSNHESREFPAADLDFVGHDFKELCNHAIAALEAENKKAQSK